MVNDYELVIIGAGVIGLACSASASSNIDSTLVIERHDSFGFEISSRNSEVIHAGIYYPENSLKALMCVKGNRSLYSWCVSHRVPYKRTGKIIVSTSNEEEDLLQKIYDQGCLNGVENLSLISQKALQKLEPNVKGTMAIYSPDTGIIDSHKLMNSFLRVAADNGCDFAWNHTVTGIEKLSAGYKLFIKDPTRTEISVTTRRVINSAGLDSDTIAGSVGFDLESSDYVLHYNRGSYFRIASNKKNIVNRLIYPVPPKDSNRLGIHLTINLGGELRLGPDSEYLEKREQNYKVNGSLKDKFFKAVNRYIIGLEISDLQEDMSGIRPSLKYEGREFRDFVIKEESDNGFENWVNLIGIESPGLTCCLEIAAECMKLLAINRN